MGKRSADGAAEAARATQKKSKGRMEAIATTDAEQQARTKPEKRVRVSRSSSALQRAAAVVVAAGLQKPRGLATARHVPSAARPSTTHTITLTRA